MCPRGVTGTAAPKNSAPRSGAKKAPGALKRVLVGGVAGEVRPPDSEWGETLPRTSGSPRGVFSAETEKTGHFTLRPPRSCPIFGVQTAEALRGTSGRPRGVVGGRTSFAPPTKAIAHLSRGPWGLFGMGRRFARGLGVHPSYTEKYFLSDKGMNNSSLSP